MHGWAVPTASIRALLGADSDAGCADCCIRRLPALRPVGRATREQKVILWAASAAAGGTPVSASMSAAPSTSASSVTGAAGCVSPAARCSGARGAGASSSGPPHLRDQRARRRHRGSPPRYRYGRDSATAPPPRTKSSSTAPPGSAPTLLPRLWPPLRSSTRPRAPALRLPGLLPSRLPQRPQLTDARLRAAGRGSGAAAAQALPKRTRRRARRRYVPAPPAALARELEAEPPCGEASPPLVPTPPCRRPLLPPDRRPLEFSKSSVARICTAGPKAIGTQALVRERLEQDSLCPAPPGDDDPRALPPTLRAMHHHALRLGLYHHPLSESEKRVVIHATTHRRALRRRARAQATLFTRRTPARRSAPLPLPAAPGWRASRCPG